MEKMSSAFGIRWKAKFDSGKELGQGLYVWPWLNGIWITVLGNGNDPLSVGVPSDGFHIKYECVAGKKLKD